jgi:hypothetical protein
MERLEVQIERFIRSGHGTFETLALEVFAYQFEKNAPYRAYCQSIEETPATVKTWDTIPAVPVHAFKAADLATFPTGHAAAVFHSSTTSGQAPSRHFLRSLTPYELSLKSSFEKWVLPDQATLPFLILTPPPGDAPRSSLVWMMDVVRRQWGAPGSEYLVRQGRLDEPRLSFLLKKFQKAGQPVALLGTTIAFLGFFDYCRGEGGSFQLPAGSRILDTGGMKGSGRETTREAFVQDVSKMLGLPADSCVNEYGMAELCSQFYGRGPSSHLEGPAWCRTLVIDPETGRPVAAGQTGLLRHFDLANVDSVSAIQTDDLGRAEGQGFVLLGRSPNAEVRGCSLSAEAFLKAVG